MKKSDWSYDVAMELISSGYIRLTKKYHPDVGGSHEQLLTLTATKEHLEKILSGGPAKARDQFTDWNRQRRQDRDDRQRRSYYGGRWHRQEEKPEFTGDVPLEPYEGDSDYVQLKDVVITTITEKAFRIKIEGVKQQQWLPKSQMLWDKFELDQVAEGDTVTLVFTKWIAKQKGWMK